MTFARPITVVKFTASRGGKKERSFAARMSLLATEKLVIDLTSPKGRKNTVDSELSKHVVPNVARTIADRISRCKILSCPWHLGLH